MKNTVKLEQFVSLKEKDLQKIKGGDMRKKLKVSLVSLISLEEDKGVAEWIFS